MRTVYCNGLIEQIYSYGLIGLLGVMVLIHAIVLSIRRRKEMPLRSGQINLIGSIIMAGLGIALLVVPLHFMHTEPILKANLKEPSLGGELILNADQTYSLKDVKTEWSCIYSGTYSILKDTIRLDKGTFELTAGKFGTSYLIRENQYLVSLDHADGWNNPDFWLEINLNKLTSQTPD